MSDNIEVKKIRAGFSLAKNNDGTRFFSCTGAVTEHDAKTFQKVASYKPLSNISDITISNNNKLLAAKNTSGKIALINLSDGTVIHKFPMEREEGSNILFSPDDKFIVDADWEGNIMIADVESGKHRLLHTAEGFMIGNITYNPNNNEFVFYFRKIGEDYSALYIWKYPFEINNLSIKGLSFPQNLFEEIEYNQVKDCYIVVKRNFLILFDRFFNVIEERELPLEKTDYVVISDDFSKILCAKRDLFNVFTFPDFKLLYQQNAKKDDYGFCSDAMFLDNNTLIVSDWTFSKIILFKNRENIQDEVTQNIDESSFIKDKGFTIETISLIPDDQLWESFYYYALGEIGSAENDSFDDSLLSGPLVINVMFSLWWFKCEIDEGGSEQYFNNSSDEMINALVLSLKEVKAIKAENLVRKTILQMAKKDFIEKDFEKFDDKLDDCEDIEQLSIDYVKDYLKVDQSI